MPRIVASLTDSKIKSSISLHKKRPDKPIKLSDGGGLYLLLDKKGGTYWRFDYVRPITKKRSTIGIGVYPSIALAEARKRREEFKELLAQNIDPSIERKLEEEKNRFANKNTFTAVATEFMKTESVAPATAKRNSFIYRYLFDALAISQFTKLQHATFLMSVKYMKGRAIQKLQGVCGQKQVRY